MLSPAQIIPFLTHEFEPVRRYALKYLADAQDPGLATADDVWRAIDHFGISSSTAAPLLQRLPDFVQTDFSTGRLLRAIDEAADKLHPSPAAKVLRAKLLLMLEDLPIEQLVRHRERVLACPSLSQAIRNQLLNRLELSESPLDTLWNQLVELSDSQKNKRRDEKSALLEKTLVAALTYVPGGAERATAYLATPAPLEWEWLELFCICLVQAARHRPALDALIAHFRAVTDEDDFVHEACQSAIPVVGGVDACEPLAAIVRECPWHIRLYAITALERIKSPESLRLLVDLLAIEQAKFKAQEDDARVAENPSSANSDDGKILSAICQLCPTGATFDLLLELARSEKYDTSYFDLREDCCVLSIITGAAFPEFPDWLRELKRETQRRAPFLFERYTVGKEDVERWERRVEGLPPLPRKPALISRPSVPSELPSQPIVEPVRNHAPKVGRNEPCPCGSGKKYKKCCIDKEGSAKA